MSHVLELDGLRAIAILLVLGCHYPGFAARLGGLFEFGWKDRRFPNAPHPTEPRLS